VGAVATQAFAQRAYGPRCLDALESGATAPEALAAAQAADPMNTLRQVGVVSADGSLAASTGSQCVDHAGDLTGDGFVVVANMVSTPEVWPAMATAFRASSGPLAHRLLEALSAGEAAGGDARGRMSAAVLVVEGSPSPEPAGGRVIDLRVDCSPDPLGELRRLLAVADVYAAFRRAENHFFGGNPQAALEIADDALETLPNDGNLRFLRAAALLGAGETDDGIAAVRALVAERPSWELIVRGFAASGLITLPADVELG
jgi:uncharacterized Ntn-hydrolase superfamily protein